LELGNIAVSCSCAGMVVTMNIGRIVGAINVTVPYWSFLVCWREWIEQKCTL